MQNAHKRFGTLEFAKRVKDTITRVKVDIDDKSVTAPQMGQELGAAYVLEGSLRRAGNKLRLNAQLIETRTGHGVWAERFDRQLEDIFAIQDEIAQSIAKALR